MRLNDPPLKVVTMETGINGGASCKGVTMETGITDETSKAVATLSCNDLM